MSRLCLVVALASSLAFGQSADAPTVNPFPEGRSAILPGGEVVPFDALCLEPTEAKRREWDAQKTAGELDKLKESKGAALVSVPVLVALLAGSLAVGAAAAAGVCVASKACR